MTRLSLVIVVILAQLAPASAHLIGGTPDNARAACRADAYRYCASVIKDDGKRHACMLAHRSQLSAGCQAVLGN